jgi:Bacterial Ig-like domain (group 2).
VNKGIVFSPNPCLASEVTWAGGTSAALYANTGNPGPALSTHWPTGQTSPQVCSATTPDTAACAYDYGYNAATDSYADAVSAFTALGLTGTPAGSAWWLDIETSNSWRSDVTLNVAALSGAVYYLGSVAHVASLGFYSTSYQWGVVTGGTSAFSAYPSWVAGAADATGAAANCAGLGFTGGGVALAQYPSGGFDTDLRCSTANPVLTTIMVAPAIASVQTGKTQQFTATGLDQFGQPMTPQPAFTWSVSGGGTISASGSFTAGTTTSGPFTVTATSGSVSGTASVTVTGLPADFSLSVSPASVSVRRGETATYILTVKPSDGFSGSVTLSLSGQPSGSTVTFTPTAATSTSTLTVITSSSGPKGTFTLTITGKSGTLTHTATIRLRVTK